MHVTVALMLQVIQTYAPSAQVDDPFAIHLLPMSDDTSICICDPRSDRNFQELQLENVLESFLVLLRCLYDYLPSSRLRLGQKSITQIVGSWCYRVVGRILGIRITMKACLIVRCPACVWLPIPDCTRNYSEPWG